MGCGASKKTEPETAQPQPDAPKKASEEMTVPGQQPAAVEATPITMLQAADILQNLALVSLTFANNTGWNDAKSEEVKNALARDTEVTAQNILILQYTKESSMAQVVFHTAMWPQVCGRLEAAVMNANSSTSAAGVVACSGGTKGVIGKGAGVSRAAPADGKQGDSESMAKEKEELKKQVAALKSQLAEATKDGGGGANKEEEGEDPKDERISELEDMVSDLKYDLAEARKASDNYVNVLQEELKQQVEDLTDKLEDAHTEKDAVEFELKQAKKASEDYLALIQEEAEEEREKREEREWELNQQRKAAADYVSSLEEEVAQLKAKLGVDAGGGGETGGGGGDA